MLNLAPKFELPEAILVQYIRTIEAVIVACDFNGGHFVLEIQNGLFWIYSCTVDLILVTATDTYYLRIETNHTIFVDSYHKLVTVEVHYRKKGNKIN